MKKITIPVLIVLAFFGYSGEIYAEIPKIVNPDLNKIIVLPSATPTPTTAIKFIPPFKEFKLLVTAGVSPTVSQITPTPTGPEASPSPEINAGTSDDMIVNTESDDTTGTSPAGDVQENGKSWTKDIVILVLVAVIMALLIISQWPKIRAWLHRKTG
jgi:hypothetical protein